MLYYELALYYWTPRFEHAPTENGHLVEINNVINSSINYSILDFLLTIHDLNCLKELIGMNVSTTDENQNNAQNRKEQISTPILIGICSPLIPQLIYICT